MGLMTKVFGLAKRQPGDISDGSSSLDRNSVLRATDSKVPTPTNPGNFESIRSAPVVPSPIYFTPEAADRLAEMAKVKTAQAKASQKAYSALKKIDTADTTVHVEHRRYESKLAGNEFGKKKADVNHAQRLQRLRPGYAQLGQGYDRSVNRASEGVANIKAGLR